MPGRSPKGRDRETVHHLESWSFADPRLPDEKREEDFTFENTKKILQRQHFSPEKSEADIKNSTKIHHGFSLNTTQRRRERSFEFQWQQSVSTLEEDNVKGKWKIKCIVVFKLIYINQKGVFSAPLSCGPGLGSDGV
ncbi:hypothetical protein FXO38_12089 [Capsicum annuum]|nr:hypothetical protein FXO38_12089 [Capsicum annuum]